MDRQWRWWWQRWESLLGCWGFRWWCRAQPVQNLHCTADRLTVISNIKKTAKKRRNWNCACGPAVILILIFQLKLKHFAVGPEADSMETASNWLQEPQTGLQTQRQSQIQIHRKVSIVCTMHCIHDKYGLYLLSTITLSGLCSHSPTCANTNTNTNTNACVSGGLCSPSLSCTNSSTRASSPSDAIAGPEFEK